MILSGWPRANTLRPSAKTRKRLKRKANNRRRRIAERKAKKAPIRSAEADRLLLMKPEALRVIAEIWAHTRDPFRKVS